MSLIQWLSIIVDSSSLIAAAIVLMFAGICYALAGLKHQDFVGSKTLGGQGKRNILNMVVELVGDALLHFRGTELCHPNLPLYSSWSTLLTILVLQVLPKWLVSHTQTTPHGAGLHSEHPDLLFVLEPCQDTDCRTLRFVRDTIIPFLSPSRIC